MKERLSNIDVIVSLSLAIVTITEWLLKLKPKYIIISLIVLAVIWLSILSIIFSNIPWHKTLRSNILNLRTIGLKRLIPIIFKKPMYESEYICPKYESYCMENEKHDDFNTEKITVIIEDDPVGYIEEIGCMIPAIAVNENTGFQELLSTMKDVENEIVTKRIFFITTPSRRLDEENSRILNDRIGQSLKVFSSYLQTDFRIISKIDSCLRSNYEPEYCGISHGFGVFSLEVLVPSYIEQGRITVHGTQFIHENGTFTPLHRSEYSSFKGLEFNNSNLALWAEKRCRHIQSRKNVGLIDIDILRNSSVEEIASRITCMDKKIKMLVFDTQDNNDINNTIMILSLIEKNEKAIFYKLGPSMINRIVSIYASRISSPKTIPVTGINQGDRGIIIAGSLSQKTKLQIALLRDEPKMSIVLISEEEINNAEILNNTTIAKKTNKILEKISIGNVILTTEFWKGNDNEYPSMIKRDTALSIFAKISQNIKHTSNRWFLFKGSDTALYAITNGFHVKTFFYCGQFMPGVIHCQCKMEDNTLKSFFIVGGNVGKSDLLVNFIKKIYEYTGETMPNH